MWSRHEDGRDVELVMIARFGMSIRFDRRSFSRGRHKEE